MKQPRQRTQFLFVLRTPDKSIQLFCRKPAAFLKLLHFLCIFLLNKKFHRRAYSESQIFLYLPKFFCSLIDLSLKINFQCLLKLFCLFLLLSFDYVFSLGKYVFNWNSLSRNYNTNILCFKVFTPSFLTLAAVMVTMKSPVFTVIVTCISGGFYKRKEFHFFYENN